MWRRLWKLVCLSSLTPWVLLTCGGLDDSCYSRWRCCCLGHRWHRLVDWIMSALLHHLLLLLLLLLHLEVVVVLLYFGCLPHQGLQWLLERSFDLLLLCWVACCCLGSAVASVIAFGFCRHDCAWVMWVLGSLLWLKLSCLPREWPIFLSG